MEGYDFQQQASGIVVEVELSTPSTNGCRFASRFWKSPNDHISSPFTLDSNQSDKQVMGKDSGGSIFNDEAFNLTEETPKMEQCQLEVSKESTPSKEVSIRSSKFWKTPLALGYSPFTLAVNPKIEDCNTKRVESSLLIEVQNFLDKDVIVDSEVQNLKSEEENLDPLSNELVRVFFFENIDSSSES